MGGQWAARVLVCAAVLLPAAGRAADEPEVQSALAGVLTGPEHRAALMQAAHAVDGDRCPAANYTTTGAVGILTPPQTDAAGRLIAGEWKEQIRESGCGADRLLNALTRAGPDGALETQPLLPGSTIADPLLQQDSVRFAAGAMGGMPPGCDQGAVTDTRFVAVEGQPPGVPPLPSDPRRPWTEVWTLQACAKRAQVEMHFKPDATGTDIRANPAKP